MRINNIEYINIEIERIFSYYIIEDIREDRKILIDYLEDNRRENIEIEILEKFKKYLEDKYKVEIKDLDNFKGDYIYFEINRENILFNIIEDLIY